MGARAGGFSGFCAAVSGLLLSAQLDTVHPTQGDAYQLDAIAACIIGGVDLAGGRGSACWLQTPGEPPANLERPTSVQ